MLSRQIFSGVIAAVAVSCMWIIIGDAFAASPETEIRITPKYGQTDTDHTPGVSNSDVGLAAPLDAAVYRLGNSYYAIVVPGGENGFQIFDITNPDQFTFGERIWKNVAGDPRAIEIFYRGGSPYAAVAWYGNNTVMSLRLTDNTAFYAEHRRHEVHLNGTNALSTYTIGDTTYAFVTAERATTYNIVEFTANSITLHYSNLTTNHVVGDPVAVATYSIGDRYYAVSVNTGFSSGIHTFDITSSSIIAFQDDYYIVDHHLPINGPTDVTIYSIGDKRYAILVAETSDAVQIFDVSSPTNIIPKGTFRNSAAVTLTDPQSVDTFTIGNNHYAIVGSGANPKGSNYPNDGVQIFDVTNPDDIIPKAKLNDNASLELGGPSSVHTYAAAGKIYALVTAKADDGIQLLQIDHVTANAGPDRLVAVNASVTLDGSRSSASAGISSYQWTQIRGPSVTLSDATAVNPAFTAPSMSSTLVFSLAVSDGTITATDTVTVTVTGSHQTLTASMSGNPREGADLWSATLSTHDLGLATHGCDDSQAGASCSSALSDNDFTFDGVEYTVKAISYKSGTYPESFRLTLDKTIPENLISCLTLHAGYAQIPLVGDAVVGAGVDIALSASNGVADSTITLTEISGVGWGLGWSAGGTDQLRLPDDACLTLTLSEPVLRTTSIQRILGGTASSNRMPDPDYHYAKLPTFTAGSTTTSMPIRVIDDNLVEGCETMTWRMTMWPGTDRAVHLFYTIYIEDNDGGDICPNAGPPPAVAVPESAQLPVITLAGSTSMTVPLNSVWTDPGYTATDSDGNDLTGSVTISGTVDTTQAATYLLSYQVTDGSGTPATSQVRTVHVVAPEPQQQTQEAEQEPQQEAEEEPKQEPEQEPEQEQTQEPTEEPEQEQTQEPTEEPEQEQTQEPTEEPEQEQTQEPTEEPEQEQTQEPTEEPEQEPEPEPKSTLPAIVQQYDTDGSGVIERDEWEIAIIDYQLWKLTTPQIQQIAAHRG